MRRQQVVVGGALLVALAVSPALSPGSASAQGCGPTRLRVSENIVLDAAPARVWAAVGDFQNMGWDRDVAATHGSNGDEVDRATRVVRLKNGAQLGESLYKYDAAAMSYSYHVDAIDTQVLPVQNVSATLEVVPVDGGAKSKLIWRAAFYRFLKADEGAPDAADAAASRSLAAFFRSGLDGVKARVDAKS